MSRCPLRDYSYYEAHAANVKLYEIISPNKPTDDVILTKQTLRRLREDNLDKITVRKVIWGVGQRYDDDSTERYKGNRVRVQHHD